MGFRAAAVLLFAIAIVFSSVACSRETLNYDAAMSLVKERNLDPVKITFSAAPQAASPDNPARMAYRRLIDAHVLECKTEPIAGMLCQPGAAGQELIESGPTELTVVAGHWMPVIIENVNRTGTSSASADVRFSFEPTPFYQEYQAAFDALGNAAGPETAATTQNAGKTARVDFAREEDGWQIESVQ